MNAREEISHLLERWRQLTQAEGRAIQLADWAEVASVQAEKAGLQKSLTAARGQFDLENPLRYSRPLLGDEFNAEVGHLLSLQTRNAELLAWQRERAESERRILEQTERNLRRLQKSYAANPSEVALDSYS